MFLFSVLYWQVGRMWRDGRMQGNRCVSCFIQRRCNTRKREGNEREKEFSSADIDDRPRRWHTSGLMRQVFDTQARWDQGVITKELIGNLSSNLIVRSAHRFFKIVWRVAMHWSAFLCLKKLCPDGERRTKVCSSYRSHKWDGERSRVNCVLSHRMKECLGNRMRVR